VPAPFDLGGGRIESFQVAPRRCARAWGWAGRARPV
jgi:hypothetical protein